MLLYEYISEYNIRFNALDYAEIVLWIISVVLMAVIGISFLKFGKKQNKNAYYIAIFFYLFIAGRISRLIAKFVVGYPYGFFEFTGVLFTLAFLYTVTTYVGLFFIYLFIERQILKKSHYFFSILVIVVTILSLLNYMYPIIMFILAPLYILVLLGLPIIFIVLGIKSSGDVRKNAFIIAIGIVMFEVGIAFDVPEAASIWINVPGMREITQFASPLLQIVGSILIWKGFPREY